MNRKESFIDWISSNKLKKLTPDDLARILEVSFNMSLNLDVWQINSAKEFSNLRKRILSDKSFKKSNKKLYKKFNANSKFYQTFLIINEDILSETNDQKLWVNPSDGENSKIETASTSDLVSEQEISTLEYDFAYSNKASEQTKLYEFFQNKVISKNFYMVYLTACENKKELELDVRVSIIGVKINGERLRFYADKLGTLKVSKLNKTYDLSKETIDLAPIYEAINEVNSYFEEHKDEVTLKDVDNTQDGGVDATRFVKHIKFGYGKILREEKDLLIIKFDDTADEKKIKYGHPSYEEISLNEYQNRQLADETGAESAARSNWDQYEAALLVEAFWKTEEAPSIKEKILIDLSNKLRRRAINKGVKIDDTFRNVNGMKMQVNKVEAFFYPERPHLNKGGSVLIAACELYKTNRSEFNRILMEAHNQVSGLITNSESDKAGTKEEPYSIALSEVDFYSYIKETYQTKHKEDGKAYRAAAHAQKCIDLIREVNLILTKENFIISDIYKVRSVSDFDKLIAFISRKTRDYEENERKWILSSLTRYRSFIEKDKSQIVSYKKNVMDVFYIKLRSNNIEARMIIESGKYKVLAGSRYSIATGTSFSSSEQEERRHLEKMGVIKNGVFVSDYSFNSSLGAAKQITGNSVSGNVVWKLPNGTTLGQYLADRSDLVKSASESPKQSDTQTSVPSAEEREHKYPDYFNVLKDCFFDGFLYSSQLRRRKFAKAYENINNKEFTDDEATYLRKLKMVGFESDGKIYLIDIVDNKLMEKIKDFIDKNLNHTGAIYYSVL